MKKFGLILGVLNFVAIAGVLGFYYYAHFIFKRPLVTEEMARAKIHAQMKAKEVHYQPVTVELDPITVNLDDPIIEKNGKQKFHYVSLKMAVELRDQKDVAKFNSSKPIFTDQIIQSLGKKKFEDLNQVQGRFLFRSQVIDAMNTALKDQLVTQVYFQDFLLQ